jgi:hypothetical protein
MSTQKGNFIVTRLITLRNMCSCNFSQKKSMGITPIVPAVYANILIVRISLLLSKYLLNISAPNGLIPFLIYRLSCFYRYVK